MTFITVSQEISLKKKETIEMDLKDEVENVEKSLKIVYKLESGLRNAKIANNEEKIKKKI